MPASVEQQERAVERAGKIFAIMRQAAERGEACPTNAVLAERFGVKPNSISRAVNFLECNGMIEVERFNDSRIVTIVSSGLRTTGKRLLQHPPTIAQTRGDPSERGNAAASVPNLPHSTGVSQ